MWNYVFYATATISGIGWIAFLFIADVNVQKWGRAPKMTDNPKFFRDKEMEQQQLEEANRVVEVQDGQLA